MGHSRRDEAPWRVLLVLSTRCIGGANKNDDNVDDKQESCVASQCLFQSTWYLTECGVLVYLSRTWSLEVWWTSGRRVGSQTRCRVGGTECSWCQRERGHFFRVSHCGERLGSLPAGLTALSRNVCDWRPGWGCALCCSLCKQSRDAKWCDLSYGVCHGISTPTWHVFAFAFPRR